MDQVIEIKLNLYDQESKDKMNVDLWTTSPGTIDLDEIILTYKADKENRIQTMVLLRTGELYNLAIPHSKIKKLHLEWKNSKPEDYVKERD